MLKNGIETEMANNNPSPTNRFSATNQPQSNGRPKGVLNSKTILERFMSIAQDVTNPITGDNETLTLEAQIHLAQLKKAKEGDLFAYKEILDRLEGKAKQSLELGGSVEQTVTRITVKKRE